MSTTIARTGTIHLEKDCSAYTGEARAQTPDGGAIDGHVVLDGATQTGTVTLRGGAGALATLSADLEVARVSGVTYRWDGPCTS
jgi:hypothetical protein